MHYKAKHIVEYAALNFFAVVFNAMPYRMALLCGAGIGRFMFHIVRFRRRETLRRIHAVFGKDFSEKETKRIARISLRNLILNMVEMMRAAKLDKQWIDTHIPEFAARIKEVRKIITEHNGAVIAVPHTGNWDLAGWACNMYDIPMISIGGKQKNPLVNRWINRKRESGIEMLNRDEKGALKKIIKLLKEGRVLAILPDVRMYKEDLSVDFLGDKANLGRGMAQFAINAKVPIIPAVFKREGYTGHTAILSDIIQPDPQLSKKENIQQMTQMVMDIIDEFIRKEPEQWFWYNKRWVLKPIKKYANARVR
ncbi:MAG: hypothetical protein R6V06_04065 [Kiritimatiellia bacterium]